MPQCDDPLDTAVRIPGSRACPGRKHLAGQPRGSWSEGKDVTEAENA